MNASEINLNESDQEILNKLSITDRKGRMMVRVGLLASFFFEEPWTHAKKQAVANVAEEYIARFGSHLRYVVDPRDEKICAIESDKVKSPKNWLPAHPAEASWYWGYHSGSTELEAGAYQIAGYAGGEAKKKLGYLHFSTPIDAFVDRLGGFRDYVVKVSEQLKPLSGYAGIGVIESLDMMAGEPFLSFARVMGERFPGLEIESRVGHTRHLLTGIKGVNWLTVLGDRWIQEMGGLDFLRLWVTEACTLYPYPGGVVIQAGAHPELGDVQANRWPMHYVKLAKALKKIRIANHYPFHLGGANRFDHEATMKWINRFDDH